MKTEPGQVKSHGSCKRHAIQEAREFVRRLEEREEEYFCTDLGDHPELIIRQKEAGEPTTTHHGTTQPLIDC